MLHKEIIAHSFWIIENTWIHVCVQKVEILVAFAEFLKTTISFVMSLSVCPPIRMEQPRLHTERIFMIFGAWLFFENLSRNLNFNENLTGMTGNLHEYQCILSIMSRSVLLRMRNVWDKRCRENQNPNFVFKTFSPKIVPFMRKFGKKKYSRAGQATDDSMSHAHWMLDT